jgi:methanogenic corrinoid protein MtbC1
VAPHRSPGGHRLYSDRQVERLRLLHRLTLGGRQIGQLVTLSDEQLVEQVLEDETAGARAPGAESDRDADDGLTSTVEKALAAVRDLDADTLERLLRHAVINLEAPVYLDRLMVPLLQRIGQAWADQEVTPAHEHLASAVVRGVGSWLLDNLEVPTSAPILVVTTPSGQRHELGAMAAAIAAASAGWRVRYLGPDLPAVEMARAVTESGANALALSLVYPSGEPLVNAELRALRPSVPAEVRILVGGAAADSYSSALDEIGAIRIGSFDELRRQLLNNAG